jgi:hypothetical protein
MAKMRTKDPRSMRPLREKVMSPERMRRLYAEMLLHPHTDQVVGYGDLEDGEGKELWLMMRFNILRTQAATMRGYLDLEAKKAYARFNQIYEARKIDFDAEELLRDYFPTNCFKYYEPRALCDFLTWYSQQLDDAMNAMHVKPRGFDSKALSFGGYFWDNINNESSHRGHVHALIFCPVSIMLLCYDDYGNTERQGRQPLVGAFQAGHVVYSKVRGVIQRAKERGVIPTT